MSDAPPVAADLWRDLTVAASYAMQTLGRRHIDVADVVEATLAQYADEPEAWALRERLADFVRDMARQTLGTPG